MWSNPRVHLFLDTDASKPEQLEKLGPKLPDTLDIIIDDGSHRYLDQEATLQTLWPRLRAGSRRSLCNQTLIRPLTTRQFSNSPCAGRKLRLQCASRRWPR